MAGFYRKRVKVAPDVYLNISKRGIDPSLGLRAESAAFGIDGRYLNTGIPGTGFYTRQRPGKLSVPRISYRASLPSAKIHSKGTYTFSAILCGIGALACLAAAPIGLVGTFILGAGVWGNLANKKRYYGNLPSDSEEGPSFLSDAKKALSEATDERHKRILANFIRIVETIDAIDDEEQILQSLNKKPAKNADLITFHSAELSSLKGQLNAPKYDVDESASADVMTRYENMCQSFEQLLTSQKIWIQVSKTLNTKAKSSAASLVDLKETDFGVGIFNYIRSRFDVPIIPVGEQLLYLYPEFAILSQTPSRFEIIDYSDISMIYTAIRFNEPGRYPSDAVKIDTTWEYINKNGGPDRRYAKNRQIAVVKYGGINLCIRGKQTVTFQVSNAAAAEDFCTRFISLTSLVNTYKQQVSERCEPKSPSKPQSAEPEIRFSFAEVIQAADRLYQCLVEMSADPQVIEALDNQKQLDAAREVALGSDKIDSRLGCVAGFDLIRCFEGLGHNPDMSTDEGRAIGIILSRILVPDNDIWHNEYLLHQKKGRETLENAFNMFKQNVQVKFEPDKFLLIEMLRHEGVDEETVNKWAVLLYRYALLIAKADGHLSDTEQKWLTNIIGFTRNGGIRTTGLNTVTRNVALPSDADPLFADAARMMVTGRGIASTSSLQRRFSIGYNRAGKIMDQLEMAGVVGPAQGAKPRVILMDSLTLEELLSNGTASVNSVEAETSSIEVDKSTLAPRKVQRRVIANPMRELEELIGLARVKAEVTNIYNLVKVQKLREAKGLNAPAISYHCVFTGNPGTGKTTVARLVAQIYKQLGILSKGHLVETDRSGLVAEYVGQTAVKTNKIIDSALDGVLFIDEAYALVQNGGGNDYGLEAIATLLKRMEDNRDRLVVILAGYSDEMKQFIDSNPGLQSRFNRYIHFEDYSAEELTSIYEFNLSKFDYRMTIEASKAVKEVMENAVATKDKKFGNARFVRNLFEKTIENQAKRLASTSLSTLTEEELTKITKEDLEQYILNI